MSIRSLNLPLCPRVSVYRALEAIIRADATIQRVMRPNSFRTWSGIGDDAKTFTIELAPAMRWTPACTAEDFATPDTMRGWLLINCEILIRGMNADDVGNFWWAVQRAIYPSDQTARLAIVQNLQNAGARSGLVLFSQPAFDPAPEGLFFAAQAQMKIDIELHINT